METLQLLSEENPILPKRSSKIDQIIKRMRWKAFFDMDGNEENTPEMWLQIVELSTKIKEMVTFEKDLWNLTNKIMF